jgi:UDP-glucuronate decarboxylase
MIEGIMRMMNGPDDFVGPVNLGNPAECQILDLAQRILRLTKANSPIRHLPLPMDDPKRRMPDITLAKERLDWEPKIDIEEGLTKTIQYFKELLSET